MALTDTWVRVCALGVAFKGQGKSMGSEHQRCCRHQDSHAWEELCHVFMSINSLTADVNMTVKVYPTTRPVFTSLQTLSASNLFSVELVAVRGSRSSGMYQRVAPQQISILSVSSNVTKHVSKTSMPF